MHFSNLYRGIDQSSLNTAGDRYEHLCTLQLRSWFLTFVQEKRRVKRHARSSTNFGYSTKPGPTYFNPSVPGCANGRSLRSQRG